jgi:hypothetical protein
VLMVAGKWNWDMGSMMSIFGGKAAIAVFINALGARFLFRKELGGLSMAEGEDRSNDVPLILVAVHLAFLAGGVVFAHQPAIFMVSSMRWWPAQSPAVV